MAQSFPNDVDKYTDGKDSFIRVIDTKAASWLSRNAHIRGEDMESALGEGEGILTETDWFEVFGWLTVDILCTSCGSGPTRIIDYETM